MTEPIVLDNTKRSTFRQCKKKYFLQHVHGLQPNFGSTAIRYGVTWHGIMEGYFSYIKENGWPDTPEKKMAAIQAGLVLGMNKFNSETKKKSFVDDYKNFNTAADAFNSFLDVFKDDAGYVKIINTEKVFECEMVPESSEEEKLFTGLPPIIYTGRIDLCLEMDHQKWIQDFKTTGWILDQVVAKANRSPQMIGYSYAGRKVLDFEPSGCLILFHQVNAYKSKKDGTYGAPKYEFRRVPQIYTADDITAWKLSFIDTVKDIFFCEQTGIWAESFDNCYQYGQCPYIKLCQQHTSFENLNTEGFHVDFWDVLEEGD